MGVNNGVTLSVWLCSVLCVYVKIEVFDNVSVGETEEETDGLFTIDGLFVYVLYGVKVGFGVVVSKSVGLTEFVRIGENDGLGLGVGLNVDDEIWVLLLCKE